MLASVSITVAALPVLGMCYGVSTCVSHQVEVGTIH